jgi:hypothetical protein
LQGVLQQVPQLIVGLHAHERNSDIEKVLCSKTPLAPILKPLIQGLKARGLCFATLDAGKR